MIIKELQEEQERIFHELKHLSRDVVKFFQNDFQTLAQVGKVDLDSLSSDFDEILLSYMMNHKYLVDECRGLIYKLQEHKEVIEDGSI